MCRTSNLPAGTFDAEFYYEICHREYMLYFYILFYYILLKINEKYM